MQLLCSTGAFSRNPDSTDPAAIGIYGPQLECDGLEVIFFPDWYAIAEPTAARLLETGLRFPVLHADKDICTPFADGDRGDVEKALDKLDTNCRFAKAIGAKLVVLHLWGLPASDKHIDGNIAALGDCIDIVRRFGLHLSVETVPCSYADPLTHIRRILDEGFDCGVTLDTEFLAYHNQLRDALEAEWLWSSRRVRHVHIKDFAGAGEQGWHRRYLQPGDGCIDFEDFFAALEAQRFDGSVSLEASAVDGQGNADVARIQASLDLLKEHIEQR